MRALSFAWQPRRLLFQRHLAALLDRRLRRGEPGDRDAERGAGDVVQAGAVAELDALGIAAVLAADADLELRALTAGRARCRSSTSGRHLPGRASANGSALKMSFSL